MKAHHEWECDSVCGRKDMVLLLQCTVVNGNRGEMETSVLATKAGHGERNRESGQN